MENTQSNKVIETRKKLFESDTFVLEELKRLQFLYGLKNEVRYGQVRDDTIDAESVAEHIYGMHIAFQYFWPLENEKGDWNEAKMLNMITFHDVDEVVTGDIIGYNKTDEDRLAEEKAMSVVFKNIPTSIEDRTKLLLDEYNERKTTEARFVKAVDKIEPIIHLFNPKGKELLQRMGTTFEQNASIKVKFFEGFPVIMRFYEVCSGKMREEGYFVEMK